MTLIDLTKKAETLLQDWQLRLGLRDWDITVKVVPFKDMNREWGHISWNLQEKIADIKLLRPDDAPSYAMRPCDLEATLVHELLHIHFAPFDAGTNTHEGIAQEQAINAIAKALVNNSRASHETQG